MNPALREPRSFLASKERTLPRMTREKMLAGCESRPMQAEILCRVPNADAPQDDRIEVLAGYESRPTQECL